MDAPACYIVSATEFAVLSDALVHLGWIIAAAFAVALIDWDAFEWRVRRFFRRRRLARIRFARWSL
jgi:hypothetical protein